MVRRNVNAWRRQGKPAAYIQARIESVQKEDYYEAVLDQHGVNSGKEYGECKGWLYRPLLGDLQQFRKARGLKPRQNCKDGMNLEEITSTDFAKMLSAARIQATSVYGVDACKRISFLASKQVADLLKQPCGDVGIEET